MVDYTAAGSVFGGTIEESELNLSDNTTGDVSTSAHGFAPKITSTSGFLKGDGTWTSAGVSLIDSQIVNGGGTGFTFGGTIPSSGYLLFCWKGYVGTGTIKLRFNSDSGTNYDYYFNAASSSSQTSIQLTSGVNRHWGWMLIPINADGSDNHEIRGASSIIGSNAGAWDRATYNSSSDISSVSIVHDNNQAVANFELFSI